MAKARVFAAGWGVVLLASAAGIAACGGSSTLSKRAAENRARQTADLGARKIQAFTHQAVRVTMLKCRQSGSSWACDYTLSDGATGTVREPRAPLRTHPVRGTKAPASSSPTLSAARRLCRAAVWPSSTGSGTAPALQPPGSCPSQDVRRVMDLVARLRAAARGNGTICALLTANERSNVRRWESQPPGYSNCDSALLTVSGAANAQPQFAQPVVRILLFYRGGRAEGLITFAKNSRTLAQPITIRATPTSLNKWEIEQIGYQF